MASIGLLKATVKVKVEMPVWQLWLHDMSLGIFSTKRRALLALHRYRNRPEHKGFTWGHSKDGLRWWTTNTPGTGMRWISRLEVFEDRVR
jgi:hypothetical protein